GDVRLLSRDQQRRRREARVPVLELGSGRRRRIQDVGTRAGTARDARQRPGAGGACGGQHGGSDLAVQALLSHVSSSRVPWRYRGACLRFHTGTPRVASEKSGKSPPKRREATLSTREPRRTALDERGDSFAEVLAPEGGEHLGVGHADGRPEVAELIRPELPLHDAEGARRALRRELAGVLPDVRQQRVVRDHSIDEPHRERFLVTDQAAGEEQITGVRYADQAGQDPRAAVLGDQTAARED